MPNTLKELEVVRAGHLKELAVTPDMRAGSITEHYDCCGKKECRCHNADHPGHGPYYAFTKKVNGKTKTLQLRPGYLLSKIQEEVQAYRAFRDTCRKLIEVNDAICEIRSSADGQSKDKAGAKKKLPRRSSRKSPQR